MDRVTRQFELFVRPNFQDYLDVEERLTASTKTIDANLIEATSRLALRAAMSAATPAYHLSDAIWQARAQLKGFPAPALKSLGSLRDEIEKRHCFGGRPKRAVKDLSLLGAVVNAYKHADLTKPHTRPIKSNLDIVVRPTLFGELASGEGKGGGINETIVILQNHKRRSFASVLRNVIYMWTRFLSSQR